MNCYIHLITVKRVATLSEPSANIPVDDAVQTVVQKLLKDRRVEFSYGDLSGHFFVEVGENNSPKKYEIGNIEEFIVKIEEFCKNNSVVFSRQNTLVNQLVDGIVLSRP